MTIWVCFNDGFISAVYDKKNDVVKVRSRRREILEALFPELVIHCSYTTDYRYRVFCTKKELADVIVNRIDSMDYSNFKNSVRDRDLHDLYSDFWVQHFNYQHDDPRHWNVIPVNKKKPR